MRLGSRLTGLVVAEWPPVLLACLSGAAYIALQLLPPLFIRDALSIMAGKQGQIVHSIGAAIVWLLVANAFRGVLFLTSNQMGHIAGYRVVRTMRLRVYAHLQRLSPA